MKLYNYDEKGIFIKASEAKIDPLETIKKNNKVFLIPARATKEKPPKTKKNETAVFINGKWETIEDIRGIYYNKFTKEKINVNDIFFNITGYTKIKPPEIEDYYVFDNVKNEWILNETKKTEITASREKEILIQKKQNEILRNQAIAELENEGKI